MLSLASHRDDLLRAVTIVFLLTTVSACGPSATATNTPIPTFEFAPSFAGRILLLGEQPGDKLSIYAFTSDSEVPEVLWSDLPGYFNTSRRPTGGPVVSPGGRYAVLPGSVIVVDLVNGDYHGIPFPTIGGGVVVNTSYYKRAGFVAAFSPDSRYLAYALRGRDLSSADSGLYVYELGSDALLTLHEAPCESYAQYQLVCGDVSQPAWLDNTTLVYDYFVGEMPQKVTFGIGRGFPEVASNRSAVVTVSGEVLHELGQALGIVGGSGQTILIDTMMDDGEADRWLEAADVRKGIAKTGNPLFGGSLSPDGRRSIDKARYYDLRHVEALPAIEVSHLSDNLVWSPDAKYVASLYQENPKSPQELYLISLDGLPEQPVLNLEEFAMSDRPGNWWLLGWLP